MFLWLLWFTDASGKDNRKVVWDSGVTDTAGKDNRKVVWDGGVADASLPELTTER